jgi:hypothetical protein
MEVGRQYTTHERRTTEDGQFDIVSSADAVS